MTSLCHRYAGEFCKLGSLPTARTDSRIFKQDRRRDNTNKDADGSSEPYCTSLRRRIRKINLRVYANVNKIFFSYKWGIPKCFFFPKRGKLSGERKIVYRETWMFENGYEIEFTRFVNILDWRVIHESIRGKLLRSKTDARVEPSTFYCSNTKALFDTRSYPSTE